MEYNSTVRENDSKKFVGKLLELEKNQTEWGNPYSET